jgi:type II secretory pathway predicted ATPase ExeA
VQGPSLANAADGYDSFFGFRHTPFSLAPDTRFVFQSASHRTALTQVTYALERRELIVVVTGEIGTGKTLLCQTVLERLERKTFVSIINDPLLGRDDLLKQMLLDFGILSNDRTTWTPTSRHDLIHALQEFLSSLAPLQAHAAVIIDEAQHLQPDVLEDIRLLSNTQDERGTMLQIILLGQNDLEELLARPELRQLQQRVSRYVRLEPLSAAEVAQYIDHRLDVARERDVASTFPGARELQRELAEWQSPTDTTFTPEAVRAVAHLSRGIPRVVNLLCDRALEAAYARQSRTVDEPFIIGAAHALGLRAGSNEPIAAPVMSPEIDSAAVAASATTPASTPKTARGSRSALAVAAIAIAAIVVAAMTLWFGQRAMNRRTERGPAPQTEQAIQPAPAPQPARPADAPPARQTEAVTPAPAASAAPPETSAAAPPPVSDDVFDIVVASFHTTARANEVAAQVAAAGESVRLRTSAGWQQVIAGPYRSKAQGQDAQQRLAHAGFAGTQLVPATR